MKIRNQLEPTERVSIAFVGPGRTKQEFADECDINNVVALHQATGSLQHVNQGTPQYGDYSNVLDYQAAKNIVIQAQNAFMQLPAKVRKRMNNDPKQLIEFLEDPANLEEGRKLGLIETPAVIVNDEVLVPAKNPPLSPVDQDTPEPEA